MKVITKKENGTLHYSEATSVLILLNNGETLEISDEINKPPVDISMGVTVWGGRMPIEGDDSNKSKASMRNLGIYPLAANMIQLFPWPLQK